MPDEWLPRVRNLMKKCPGRTSAQVRARALIHRAARRVKSTLPLAQVRAALIEADGHAGRAASLLLALPRPAPLALAGEP